MPLEADGAATTTNNLTAPNWAIPAIDISVSSFDPALVGKSFATLRYQYNGTKFLLLGMNSDTLNASTITITTSYVVD